MCNAVFKMKHLWFLYSCQADEKALWRMALETMNKFPNFIIVDVRMMGLSQRRGWKENLDAPKSIKG